MSPTPTPHSGPPQFLPISAQWCLVNPAAGDEKSKPACIELELAATPQQQQWGLMGRPPLAPLRGMWFPFRPARTMKFWMYRTPAPLDMVFLHQGQVIAIEANAAPCPRLPCPSYGPEAPADGVVELAAGQAGALGISVGTRAAIQPNGKGLPLGKSEGVLPP